ncbi:prolipoprotein diacylglyceryl transferase [Dellaglioa sp. P0083]|uniref:prolipoprotein diacylglyceryl transferase n=1 Tax=Dellaglioa kimchii TaxID=3344667 RepID=UPI0038D38F28
MNYLLGALNPIAVKLGPIEVRWYGVIIASAVIIAVILAILEGKKIGINEDTIYDMVLWALPISIISARLYYVVFEWSYYSQHLSEVYRIWDGGIAIYGGLIGAIITVIIFCQRRHLSAWLMFDLAAPLVLLAQSIGRWGNFMNQEAHGGKTTLEALQNLHLPEFIINQMNINGIYYKPTFLYESLWSFVGFLILIALRHRVHLFKRGEILFAYLTWYSFGRFFIEGMRTDSLMLFSTIRVSQLLSLVIFIGSISWLLLRRYWEPQNQWYLDGQLK